MKAKSPPRHSNAWALCCYPYSHSSTHLSVATKYLFNFLIHTHTQKARENAGNEESSYIKLRHFLASTWAFNNENAWNWGEKIKEFPRVAAVNLEKCEREGGWEMLKKVCEAQMFEIKAGSCCTFFMWFSICCWMFNMRVNWF